MVNRTEINRLAALLDKEYAEEIKPLLTKAQEAVDGVLSVIRGEEYHNMRKRCNLSNYKFEYIPTTLSRHLSRFGYYGVSYNDYQIASNEVSKNLVTLMGYSEQFYGENGGMVSVLSTAEAFRTDDVKALEAVTEMKKRFNGIKDSFNEFFTENGGELFKEFGGIIADVRNKLEKADAEKDNALYALFGKVEKPHKVKITVTVEM